jgi:hypothetical protein
MGVGTCPLLLQGSLEGCLGKRKRREEKRVAFISAGESSLKGCGSPRWERKNLKRHPKEVSYPLSRLQSLGVEVLVVPENFP